MGVKLKTYRFDGPFGDVEDLQDRAGIYAVLCSYKNRMFVIDLGQDGRVKRSVKDSEDAECWKKSCKGKLAYAVYYTGKMKPAGRKDVVDELSTQFTLPCGD